MQIKNIVQIICLFNTINLLKTIVIKHPIKKQLKTSIVQIQFSYGKSSNELNLKKLLNIIIYNLHIYTFAIHTYKYYISLYLNEKQGDIKRPQHIQ